MIVQSITGVPINCWSHPRCSYYVHVWARFLTLESRKDVEKENNSSADCFYRGDFKPKDLEKDSIRSMFSLLLYLIRTSILCIYYRSYDEYVCIDP